MAILLALASPELQVLGIVAVAGNVPLALTEVVTPARWSNCRAGPTCRSLRVATGPCRAIW